MKSKSASVQNLEYLVRQTIDTVSEVDEGTIRFQRMIYEQWDSKRSFKSKATKSEQNHAKSQITSEQVIKDISKTIGPFRRRLRRPSHKHRFSRLSLSIQHAEANVENAQKNSNAFQNVENLSINNEQSLILNNNSSNVNGIQLFSIDPPEIVHRPSIGDHDKVIEIWNNRKLRNKRIRNNTKNVLDVADRRDRNNGSIETQQKAVKKSITFEAWKRGKSIAHKKLMKQLAEEKQRKEQEALEEATKKNAIQQVQMHCRKRQQRPIQTSPKSDCLKNKRDIERDVVATPTERTRMKSDEGKTATLMTIRKSNNGNNGRKQVASMQNTLENVIFCSWLNELNWTLHKKYLRERRHLVRSFYCQPVYYGDATLYVR